MFWIKVALSVIVLLAAVEVAKRSAFWGALIVAMPLTSMLAIAWLYWDTRDALKVSEFARDIFYLVPPSLLFFVPFLLAPRTHWPFWLNFAAGVLAMAGGTLAVKYLIK